jgi:mannan polymerase complexes MNN9 subunit
VHRRRSGGSSRRLSLSIHPINLTSSQIDSDVRTWLALIHSLHGLPSLPVIPEPGRSKTWYRLDIVQPMLLSQTRPICETKTSSMARPLGPVRLRRTNYVTLSIGAVLCLFIIYFVSLPTSSSITAASRSRPSLRKPAPQASLNTERREVQRFKLNDVTITSDPIANHEAVLVLTPMARFYQGYWDNLVNLNFPHELITLGFILPKTREGNAATAALQSQIKKYQKGPNRFRRIIIERQDFEPPFAQDESERHKMENQKARRSAMSVARNSLLFTTLGPDTSWVLWLDADIVETPSTLIQDLASHDKPIIVPNCFQKYYNDETSREEERAYDFNSWQDSVTAQTLASNMGPDEILLEGYAEMATYRTLMAYVETSDPTDVHLEIPLDGVGGTALLVRADVHRDGAMFPPFPFYHLIETEGFAKMARRLGWHSTGLPNYKVGVVASKGRGRG